MPKAQKRGGGDIANRKASLRNTKKGSNSLRCTKILLQVTFFLVFLPSFFLPCKNTFINDYDGSRIVMVENIVLLTYLTTFDSLFFMEIKI